VTDVPASGVTVEATPSTKEEPTGSTAPDPSVEHVNNLATNLAGAAATAPFAAASAALDKISPTLSSNLSAAISTAQTHASNAASSIQAQLPTTDQASGTMSSVTQTIQDYAAQAVQAVREATGTAASQASDTYDQAASAASDAASQAKTVASDKYDQATSAASDAASQAQGVASDTYQSASSKIQGTTSGISKDHTKGYGDVVENFTQSGHDDDKFASDTAHKPSSGPASSNPGKPDDTPAADSYKQKGGPDVYGQTSGTGATTGSEANSGGGDTSDTTDSAGFGMDQPSDEQTSGTNDYRLGNTLPAEGLETLERYKDLSDSTGSSSEATVPTEQTSGTNDYRGQAKTADFEGAVEPR